jgi:O-antigen/teichoic acid export membrane protein
MSYRTSRALKGTLTSFLQMGVQIGLRAVLAPLILRVAGAETLGAYGILQQAIGYLVLTDLGFGVAVGRYLAQTHGSDDGGRRFRQVITIGKTFSLGTTALYALLALILSQQIGRIFSLSGPLEQQARQALTLLAVWSLLRVPLGVYGAALVARQNLAVANLTTLVGSAARLLISLGLVAAGVGLIGLMLADIMAEALTYAVQRAYFRRLYPGERWGWGIPDWRLLREMVGFGLQYILAGVANRLVFSTDNLVVGGQHGPTATAAYYSTQTPTYLLVALVWKLADNSSPAMNELYAREAFDPLRSAYLRLLRYSLLLALGLALGLLGFNRLLITLWVGEGQYAGQLMTVALAVFAVGTAVNHVNSLVLIAYGAVRWLSLIGIVGGLTNLLLSIWLGRAIGLQGVMVASAVVEIAAMLAIGLHLPRRMRFAERQVWREAIAPALAACALPAIVLVASYLWRPMSNWVSLGLWGILFSFAWCAGVVSLGLKAEEVQQVLGYVRRALGKWSFV